MLRFAWVLILFFASPVLGEPIGPMPEAGGAVDAAADSSTTVSDGARADARTPGRSERPLGAIPGTDQPDSQADPVSPAGAKGWMTGTALPLLGVLAIIVALAWVYRRFSRSRGGISSALGAGGHAPSGVLSVLARFPVGGGMTLVLLQLDRRVLLVSHSGGSMFRGRPGSMSLLTEIVDEESVASLLVRTQDERGESMSKRFNELLQGYSDDVDDAVVDVPPASVVDELADDGESATAELSPLRRRLERLMRHAPGERAAR